MSKRFSICASLVLALGVLAHPPLVAARGKTPRPTVRDFAGERVALEGTLEVLVEDRHDGSRSLHFLVLDSGERLALSFASREPRLLTGTRVKVTGQRIGQAIAVESGSRHVQRLSGATAESAQSIAVLPNTFGVQTTVVILVNWANDASQPYTVAQAEAGYGALDNWYREVSYQQTSLDVDVFGWFTMPIDNTSCDTDQIRSSAQQKAADAGVNLSNYLRQVYAFPFNSNCLFAGLATRGGNPSSAWINGSSNTGILAHELGHNQGLYHSHALKCHPNVLTGTCTVADYGDVTDAMGGGFGHFNAFQKVQLGWLDYNVSPPITHVQASGTYTIAAYELPGTAPKALMIPRGSTGESFFVELRRPVGWDDHLYATGVFVHLARTSDLNSSELLDMRPDTFTSDDDFLDVGQTFTDPVTGISVTAGSVSATDASLSIAIPEPTATPTATPTFAATPTITRTPTRTPTGTRTATFTRTPTLTRTQTRTSTPTRTSTSTRTSTPTPSSTTPASTLTPTATPTPSATPTPTPTGGAGTGTFSDNFNRASLGPDWSPIAGSFVLNNNMLKNAPGAGTNLAVVAPLTGATETAEADFTSVDNNQAPRFGVVLRYRDSGNYYLIGRRTGGSSLLVVSRVVNGIETTLATASISNPVTNVSFHLKGRVTGTTLSLDLDGVNKINVTDATFAAGQVGILLGSNSATLQYPADNFNATAQ